ncbi:MAG: 30S ribosomal protein S20 [Bdellovibrionaceae bacterium]|nr:30S ribosomal protein S20 [Pseudobdellovibrionaceae bacterium]
MATHKSAEKRARQTLKKNTVNSARRSKVRTAEKKLIKALTTLDLKAVPELLKTYTSEATRAVSKGVFKKQTISRKVGRLATKAHKVATASKAK